MNKPNYSQHLEFLLDGLEMDRCDWCRWPLKPTPADGCVEDKCSMRPLPKISQQGRYKQAIRQAIREIGQAQEAAHRKIRCPGDDMNKPKPDLATIKAYCEKAMAGPWEVYFGKLGVIYPPSQEDNMDSLAVGVDDCPSKYGLIPQGILFNTDAVFIARARTDLPALVEYAERLEKELERDSTVHERAIKEAYAAGDKAGYHEALQEWRNE